MGKLSVLAIISSLFTLFIYLYLRNLNKLKKIEIYKKEILEIHENYIKKSKIILDELKDYSKNKTFENEIIKIIDKNDNSFKMILDTYKNKLERSYQSFKVISLSIDNALKIIENKNLLDNQPIYNLENSRKWEGHQQEIFKLLNLLDSEDCDDDLELKCMEKLKLEVKELSLTTDKILENWC